jgi:hypothetical protein
LCLGLRLACAPFLAFEPQPDRDGFLGCLARFVERLFDFHEFLGVERFEVDGASFLQCIHERPLRVIELQLERLVGHGSIPFWIVHGAHAAQLADHDIAAAPNVDCDAILSVASESPWCENPSP